MIAVIALLIAVLVLLLVARVATVALVATGMPIEMARFQARSAITGVGFTTTESEAAVNHPVRRRILMILMVMGNAGLVTIVASTVIGFAGEVGTNLLVRLTAVIAGIVAIGVIARSKAFERRMSRLIARALNRWTELDVKDYVHLMQLTNAYAIIEMQVQPGDWLADKTLAAMHLPDEGVLVLGVRRADGGFTGAPRGNTVVHPYDQLVLYGRTDVLSDLDERPDAPEGDAAHEDAVAEQAELMAAKLQAAADSAQTAADAAQAVADEARNEAAS